MSRETVTVLLALAAVFFAATGVRCYRASRRTPTHHYSLSYGVWAGISVMLAIYCVVALALLALL